MIPYSNQAYWFYQNKIRPLFDKERRFCIDRIKKYKQASLEEVEILKNEAFVNLIDHVYHHVPYYHRLMKKEKLCPKDFTSIHDIEKLPPLTKDIIRANKNLLRADNYQVYKSRRSGGTTGEPIETLLNKRAQIMEVYAHQAGIKIMGRTRKDININLFGGSLGLKKNRFLDLVKDKLQNKVFLPAFDLNNENLEHYIGVLREYPESVVIGYTSALYNFADLILKKEYQDSKMKMVVSTAEYLPNDWAAAIRTAFHCPIKQYYGCGEINSLGYQEQDNGPYIIPDEHVHIESLNSNEGSIPKNSLLVTSLFNYAQPLIRYVNGDMGIIAPPAEQTYNRSSIQKLLGRSADNFVKKDGSLLSASFAPHLIFKTQLPVLKYQFIQKSMNTIEFRYTSKRKIKEKELEQLKHIIQQSLQVDEIKFESFSTTNFILSKSGKHRIMISEVNR